MRSVITSCLYNDTREDNTSPTTRARFNLIHKTDGAAVITGSYDICTYNCVWYRFLIAIGRRNCRPLVTSVKMRQPSDCHLILVVLLKEKREREKIESLETLSRKPRLGAGRIRRKRSATSCSRTTRGKLPNDKRRDGI